MALADIVEILRKEIRDTGEEKVFTDDDLQSYLTSALRDYSGNKPYLREGSMNLVAGVSKYPLPDDFLGFYEELEEWEYRIIDSQLRLIPIPSSSYEWSFDYRATWPWDKVDPNPLVLFAKGKAYNALAGDEAMLAKYKIGKSFEVDNSKLPDYLIKLAAVARQQYEDQVYFVAYGSVG